MIVDPDQIDKLAADIVRRFHDITDIGFRVFHRINVFLNGSDDLRRHTDFAIDRTDDLSVRNIAHIIAEYEKVRI